MADGSVVVRRAVEHPMGEARRRGLSPVPHGVDTKEDDVYGKPVIRCRHCGERVGDEQPAHLVFRRKSHDEGWSCITLAGTDEQVDALQAWLFAAGRNPSLEWSIQ